MAMYENSVLMDREIERLNKALENLDPTDDDYERVVSELDKLYKLRNDQYRAELTNDSAASDREASDDRHEKDLQMKQQEIDLEERKRADASERARAEAAQKANELELRKLELELEERKRQDAAKKAEAEEVLRVEEMAIKKQELEVVRQQHEDSLAENRKQRMHDGIVSGANIITGMLKVGAAILFGVVMADQGYRFEENGCPTSTTFREARKNAIDIIKDAIRK